MQLRPPTQRTALKWPRMETADCFAQPCMPCMPWCSCMWRGADSVKVGWVPEGGALNLAHTPQLRCTVQGESVLWQPRARRRKLALHVCMHTCVHHGRALSIAGAARRCPAGLPAPLIIAFEPGVLKAAGWDLLGLCKTIGLTTSGSA